MGFIGRCLFYHMKRFIKGLPKKKYQNARINKKLSKQTLFLINDNDTEWEYQWDQATLNVAMYHLDPKGQPYMHTTVFRNQSVDEDILVSENEANNANRDTDRSYRFVHATSYPKLPSPQMTRHVSSTLGATVPARIDENDIPTDFLKSIRPYLLREQAKIDWCATKAIHFPAVKWCAATFSTP